MFTVKRINITRNQVRRIERNFFVADESKRTNYQTAIRKADLRFGKFVTVKK